jgi:glycosyltransferase involved in cell wall biosynthesis
MISFIIPARNEESLIGRTVDAIHRAALASGEPYEVIVVDDASTDRTAEVSLAHRAKLVRVDYRKIAAVRNAGARLARGDLLIFVDADTLVPAKTLQAVLKALGEGAVGGGAWVQMADGVPRWGRVLTRIIVEAYGRAGFAGGCFLFARREAFQAVGGFDEAYFASEEVHLSRALKKRGRFVIVHAAVTTSGRKFRLLSPREFLRQLLELVRRGVPAALKQRDALGMWYDDLRETNNQAGHSRPS